MQSTVVRLKDLPSPPSSKTGWPWSDESAQLPDTLPDGSPWPRISIVTPSYNQGQFIEETIRSVLLQGYPNLEYIIIDGGSTDNSVEIIKKYSPWLTYWLSEKDRGQSHAINKGFARSTGEIMAWINSDDYYERSAFEPVGRTFVQTDTQWVAGGCFTIGLHGNIEPGVAKPKGPKELWAIYDLYYQPSVFWRRNLWAKTDGIDEELHFSFDYDLWTKFSSIQPFALWINQTLAYFRVHPNSKTSTNRGAFLKENTIIQQRMREENNNPISRFIIWKLRREGKANSLLSIQDRSIPPHEKIIAGLVNAPWYVFRWQFYYKAKNILFPKNKR